MINYKLSGERIRKQRKLLGLTQEKLAERIKITPSFYSQIESGARKAGINTFVSLSHELSLSLDYILGNDVQPPSVDSLDEIEYKILHQLKKLSQNEKEFVFDVITSLDKLK